MRWEAHTRPRAFLLVVEREVRVVGRQGSRPADLQLHPIQETRASIWKLVISPAHPHGPFFYVNFCISLGIRQCMQTISLPPVPPRPPRYVVVESEWRMCKNNQADCQAVCTDAQARKKLPLAFDSTTRGHL